MRHYANGERGGDDAVDKRLDKRIEETLRVRATHELGLEQVATAPVELELALVQLHAQVCASAHIAMIFGHFLFITTHFFQL